MLCEDCCELVATPFAFAMAWQAFGFPGPEGCLCSQKDLQTDMLASPSTACNLALHVTLQSDFICNCYHPLI